VADCTNLSIVAALFFKPFAITLFLPHLPSNKWYLTSKGVLMILNN
jgi:hypothetical protein